MERNKNVLRDARKIARLLAREARWDAKKTALWIAVFVGEVRCMAAVPPRDPWPLGDELPF